MASPVEDILALALKYRARRICAGDIEVELHDSAFAGDAAAPAVPPPPPEMPDDRGTVCACGHSIEIEHGSDGCLNGCSLAVCAAKRGEEPPEGA
jgi:hypothetical protein